MCSIIRSFFVFTLFIKDWCTLIIPYCSNDYLVSKGHSETIFFKSFWSYHIIVFFLSLYCSVFLSWESIYFRHYIYIMNHFVYYDRIISPCSHFLRYCRKHSKSFIYDWIDLLHILFDTFCSWSIAWVTEIPIVSLQAEFHIFIAIFLNVSVRTRKVKKNK